jgi:hypothetical protein
VCVCVCTVSCVTTLLCDLRVVSWRNFFRGVWREWEEWNRFGQTMVWVVTAQGDSVSQGDFHTMSHRLLVQWRRLKTVFWGGVSGRRWCWFVESWWRWMRGVQVFVDRMTLVVHRRIVGWWICRRTERPLLNVTLTVMPQWGRWCVNRKVCNADC